MKSDKESPQTPDFEHLVRKLMRDMGIQPEYSDNWSRIHRTDTKTGLALLGAKGIRIDPELAEPAKETVVVAQDAVPEFHRLRVDRRSNGISVSVEQRITDENGGERIHSVGSDRLQVTEDDDLAVTFVDVPFPSDLSVGIYDVLSKVTVGEETVELHALWFICPAHAFLPQHIETDGRVFGIGLALYGVRSENNWGIGDFGDLRRLVEWARHELGADFLGLNPLHALFNRRPYNVSPYLPSSRLFHNFIYLDVPSVDDFQSAHAAKEFLEREATRQEISRLRNEPEVDYESVAALKLNVLAMVFDEVVLNRRMHESDDPVWADFRRYMDEQGEYLHRYAVFCTIDEHFLAQDPPSYGRRAWPEELQDPRLAAVEQFAAQHANRVLFWKFVQWQTARQLAAVHEFALSIGMGIGLYHDEALAIDRDGADFWALQDFYLEGFTVGAPPDAFSPEGQDWGFAPPHRDRMKKEAYEPYRKNIGANCAYGGALRIDHVMQLNRLFWIPLGRPASEGVYVEDFEADLLNLLALESVRHRTLIVGEDLGTVPYGMRDRLMAKRVLSYRLFYFERDEADKHLPPSAYPVNALVSITTHDLPTLAGFWSEWDIDKQRDVGRLDHEGERSFREHRSREKRTIVERLVEDGFLPRESAEEFIRSKTAGDELQTAVLSFLFRTPSRLALVNQEDLFLDERQQNMPGTTSENPNWATKMRFTVEDLFNDTEAVRLTRKCREIAQREGRTA